MNASLRNYRREFLRSPHHAVFGLLTLGIGFLSGQFLPLIIGGTFYALGWLYLPDMPFFRQWVDARADAADATRDATALAALQAQREKLFALLDAAARRRYEELARVCADIEEQLASAPADAGYPTGKIDGLMWSYLGLLATERNLQAYLAKEEAESFPARIAAVEADLAKLDAELAKTPPESPAYEGKFRLIGSKREGLDAVRRRHEQFSRSLDNLAIVRAEQTRIEEQLKLLRADLFAAQSAGQFSQRISDTIDSLSTGSRVAAELTPSMPELPSLRTRRVGYKVGESA